MELVRPLELSSHEHRLMLVLVDDAISERSPQSHCKLKEILTIQGTFMLCTLHKLYKLLGINKPELKPAFTILKWVME